MENKITDGIYTKEDPVIIEEIKSTLLAYDQIDDSIFVHFAQCYVYAYFYLLQQEECASLIARVTYHQAESGQSKHFDHVRTREELTAFYAENYAQDYPEPEAIITAVLAGYRVGEAPVQMRERMGGASSINALKSIYYMVKVTISLVVFRIITPKRKGGKGT